MGENLLNISIDENLVKLKKSLDPLLEATNENYRKVKTKNGFEKVWRPLFVFYHFKQLVSRQNRTARYREKINSIANV